MAENSTKILLSTTLTPDRGRNFVNAIYVTGIVFMLGVFLILLWVNLCSRHCRCWHDTPIINRFNHHWLIRNSNTRNNNQSSSKTRHQQHRRPSNEDELE